MRTLRIDYADRPRGSAPWAGLGVCSVGMRGLALPNHGGRIGKF
jgi:hypothetical protein